MKNARFLIAVLVIIMLSCIFVFAACSEGEYEAHGLAVSIEDFEYNGNAASPTIVLDLESDECVIEWYSVSEAGELTALEEAPKTPGTYKVRVYIKGSEQTEAQVTFTISKALPTVEVPSISKVYDGQPVVAPAYTTTSDSSNITVKYRGVNPETDWTDVAPYAVGDYEVKVSVAESGNYKSEEKIIGFSIVESATMVNMYVNPSVDFLVANDGTVISISAGNDEGHLVESLLLAQEAKGKSIEDVIQMAIAILNEKGYVLGGEDITISAQKESIGTLASQAALAKLNNLGINANVLSDDITAEDIKNKAKSCLFEYSADQIDAMSVSDVILKLQSSLESTQNIANSQLIDLYNLLYTNGVLSAKLSALIDLIDATEQLPEALKQSLSTALTSMNDAVDSIEDEYSNSLRSGEYMMLMYSIAQLKQYVLEGKANNYPQKSVAAYESYINSFMEIFQQMEAMRKSGTEMVVAALNSASQNVDLMVTNIRTILNASGVEFQDLNIDYAKIERDVKAYFEEEYGNYISYNPWTGENLYIIAKEVLDIYKCEEMNKTFVLVENQGYKSIFEFNGILEDESIPTTQAAAWYVYEKVDTGTAYALFANVISKYQFVVGANNELSLSFIPKSTDFIYTNQLFAGVPATFVLTMNAEAYMFEGTLTKEEIYSVPLLITGTYQAVPIGGDTILSVDLGMAKFGFKFDGNFEEYTMTIIQTEGEVIYSGSTVEEGSFISDGLWITFNEVNGEKIAYAVSARGPFDKAKVFPYEKKANWTISENIILVWFSNTEGYKFVIEDGVFRFDKALSGD